MVAVLGMHRSGTSWLAGSLYELGLELGSVNEQAAHNAKGNRENDVLQAIHGAVLHDSGGAWDSPPDSVVWSEARRAQLAAFIAGMNERFRLWGFKDPRTLLVLDEWHRQVPQLERVGIFRHPVAVAASLAARSPVPTDTGLRLWQAYNERLVAEHRRDPFPVVRFDGPAARLPQALEAVARHLELPRQVAPGFFDSSLVRQDGAAESVPETCVREWDYLFEHAL